VVGLVLKNNPELMGSFKGAPKSPAVEHKKVAEPKKQLPQPRTVVDKAEFSAPPERGSIILERVECRLLDRPDLVVYVSLNMIFTLPALKDEILLKRDSLRTLLRAVVAGKRLEEIVVEPLRTELKSRFNRVLESGAIEDIEFRDFRIDSRNGSSE
jgi:flagellar basal body-associated protein FliL